MSFQLPLFSALDRSERWAVRVSARARRLSVRIFPGGKVEVVVPPRVPSSIVQRFIGQHRDWIERRVQAWQAVATPAPVRPERLELPALGISCFVEYQPGAGATRARMGSDALQVGGRVDDLRSVARALERWLREQVLDAMEAQVQALAAQGGFRYSRIRIRRQRTRWGSCSSKGTLSLNVCLAFLEPAVARYLLVHELCHTRHMNHSDRFWALVEHHEPGWRHLDRALNEGWRQVPPWILL